MGIRYLNRFLRLNCKNNIKLVKLNDLSNKTIVVDISVYLYRFQSEGSIIDGLYQMITLFKHNNIELVFVFDGKPPSEKTELLKKRREDKQTAEKKYKELEKKLKKLKKTENQDELNDIEIEMDVLRKSFIRITHKDIENVKKLIGLFGLTYYIADGESDYLCVKLVKEKKAWACLSEDMDMFVYGCPRVLRYLSLLKSNVVMYNFKGILRDLNLSHKEFKEICVLSGTDYNISDKKDEKNRFTLNKVLILFSKYRNQINPQTATQSFYEWLVLKEIIDNTDLEKLYNICNIFDYNQEKNDEKVCVSNEFNKEMLQEFLEDYDFVFV